MTAVIYNCKRCKRGRRVEYPRVDEHGQRVRPGIWVLRSGGGKATVYGGDPLGLCDSCGKPMQYGVLEVTVDPSVKCDARCRGARGRICSCSCGGKNHGAGWSAAPAAASLALESA